MKAKSSIHEESLLLNIVSVETMLIKTFGSDEDMQCGEPWHGTEGLRAFADGILHCADDV